ncbi:MAG: hypothetical protein II994_01240 [Lachnospiraceae bacterium]|nr:hypothetical protein [Lachnospiraceae bacterium]
MARREDAPSSLIIGGTRYIIEKRNLLCEAMICDPDILFDLKSKTLRLYCPKGKAFVVDVEHDMTGRHDPPEVITREEAFKIMDKYPEGINESVYEKYFGAPEEL